MAAMDVNKHLWLLGLRVEEKVTGAKGVAVSISGDLYGCIQVLVNPGMDKDGKLLECFWFDVTRLRVLDPEPVMAPPDTTYDPSGPAEKPVERSH